MLRGIKSFVQSLTPIFHVVEPWHPGRAQPTAQDPEMRGAPRREATATAGHHRKKQALAQHPSRLGKEIQPFHSLSVSQRAPKRVQPAARVQPASPQILLLVTSTPSAAIPLSCSHFALSLHHFPLQCVPTGPCCVLLCHSASPSLGPLLLP